MADVSQEEAQHSLVEPWPAQEFISDFGGDNHADP